MINEETNISLSFWESCQDDLFQHWIAIFEQLNQQLFKEQNNGTINKIEIISDFRNLFEQIRDNVDDSNRRSYCKVLLNYCDLTQDWKDWGDWAKLEIEKGIGQDAPWLYYGLGRYFEEIGQLQNSIDYHQLGIIASRKSKDRVFLSYNCLGSGIAFQRYNKPNLAESNLLQALDLFKQHSDFYSQANTLANLGSCYDRFQKSKLAIDCYHNAANVLREIGNDFDLGRILYSLGIAHLNLNELTKAETVLSEAQNLCKNNGNLYFLALSYYGVGWLKYKQGNFQKSQDYLEDSIRQLRNAKELGIGGDRLSFPEIEGNIYIVAAAAYSKGYEPNFAAANKYLEQAKNFYSQLDYAEIKLLNVLANQARIYEYSQNWSEAISAFLELLKEGKRLDLIKTVEDASIHLVRIYYKKSASFKEWFKLAKKLGFLGLKSLLIRFATIAKKWFENNLKFLVL